MNIKNAFSLAVKDRPYMTIWAVSLVLLLVLIILGAFFIRPTDLQVPVRYSSFGITNFYREKWFYEFNFIVFGLIIGVFHSLIGLRFFEQRGRSFAIAFQWLTIIILIISLATITTIFRVVSLSQ